MLTCVTGVAGSGKSSLVAELIDRLRPRPAGGGQGRRYRDDVLKLTWRGRSIHDVLEMTVADALRFFSSVENPRERSAVIGRGLQLLVDVGVGYLRLGQSLATLSGGEAQRLKRPQSFPSRWAA